MLAVKPPSMFAEAAPKWLVDESQGFSKAEFQASERARQTRTSSDTSGSPYHDGGKGGRKGKPKGKAAAKKTQ